MKTSEYLSAAKALIEASWCKGSYAKIAKGEGTNARDPEATTFCAIGAAIRVNASRKLNDTQIAAETLLIEALPAEWKESCVEDYNDYHETTKEDIVALYDRAIVASKCTEAISEGVTYPSLTAES